jgi:hypothetical protein
LPQISRPNRIVALTLIRLPDLSSIDEGKSRCPLLAALLD